MSFGIALCLHQKGQMNDTRARLAAMMALGDGCTHVTLFEEVLVYIYISLLKLSDI
jgi:hypothetical protein